MVPSFAPHLPSDACSCHSSTMDPSSSIPGSAPVSSRVSNDIDRFSKTGRLGHLFPDMDLEVLSFSNRFWCEKLKDALGTNFWIML